ncbi:aldo/keto reductase [Gilvimarinus sp. SDUM040013]|uniref:Aldo/keto reductase n=1 Tax=Gilvimarinus gilvus TaxID=3058038 RepID=A0ABU4S2H0_9GAMM|nr:aldo/keto reductase [Gilvimarinus sp. SDUM040013]MDO3386684.1 aldo/keto reductase [Gilvimarinus sp. SDUM040013]MDX6849429.1 aldo/keto reductase [Gilvimarinus sp. SDUM040013]
MKTRTLGNTGFDISEVGLGCWQLGGDFGPIDSNTIEEIFAAALDSGINFFDTADVYGAGASESFVGQHLGSLNPKPVIASKYGRGAGTYPDGYSLTDIRDNLKRAQDRLRCDSIDLIQLHCIPTEVMRRGEIFDWLRTVQQEKHIKFFGASVETVEEGLICAEQEDLSSLQVIFNIFRQKLVDELLPMAAEKNIGIIARLPLASGLLSGKFKADTQFDKTDHRNFNKDGEAFNVGETFAGIPFTKGVELAGRIKELTPEGYTTAQMAMRWILDHPAVTTIIPGASRAQQAVENAKVSELPSLSAELHAELKGFYKDEVAAHIRGVY